MSLRVTAIFAALLGAGWAALPATAQCTPEWDTTLGAPGVLGTIMCSTMYDDGNGPALYVGGNFATISGSRVFGIAKTYDGQRWYPLAGGLRHGAVNPGIVQAMAVYDLDGAGPNPPALVVGGRFTQARNDPNTTLVANYVAAWNGTEWSAVGAGFSGTPDATLEVKTLRVFDSGSGPRLYAGGDFMLDGLGDVAVWDGSGWQPVGLTGALGGWVSDLLVHDDGSGPALYVCGNFNTIIGAAGTNKIARWNGTAWSSVGGGQTIRIDRLVAFDDDGPGGSPAKLRTIRGGALNTWDGTAWSGDVVIPFTSGLMINSGSAVFDDGSGEALYIGPMDVNGAAKHLMRYDGTAFTEVGDELKRTAAGAMSVWHLGVHTLGGTPAMIVSGIFSGTDAIPTPNMLAWRNGNYAPVSSLGGAVQPAALPHRFSSTYPRVSNLLAFDLDGAGPQPPSMLVCGEFGRIGNVIVNGLAARTGSTWSGIAGGVPNAIRYSVLFSRSTPSGDELYVVAHGDASTPTYPIMGAGVHKLSNGVWTSLGASFGFRGRFVDETSGYDTAVIAGLASVDFGAGDELFAFGRIDDFNGTPIALVARWNGTSWEQVGAGLEGIGFPDVPTSGVSFNDGTGPALWVAGTFTGRVAKWNGVTWATVTAGLPTVGVEARSPQIMVFNGQLWAWISGVKTLYRWDGAASSWIAVATAPTTFNSVGIDIVSLIGVANNGTGERIYFSTAAPVFTAAGWGFLEFDGANWSSDPAMGRTNVGGPSTVAGQSVGGESSLWFGGTITGVGGDTGSSGVTVSVIPSGGLARWFCAPPPCPADFNHSGAVSVLDIFDYLGAYFGRSPSADFNHSGGITVEDIFAFLGAYFTGCS